MTCVLPSTGIRATDRSALSSRNSMPILRVSAPPPERDEPLVELGVEIGGKLGHRGPSAGHGEGHGPS